MARNVIAVVAMAHIIKIYLAASVLIAGLLPDEIPMPKISPSRAMRVAASPIATIKPNCTKTFIMHGLGDGFSQDLQMYVS